MELRSNHQVHDLHYISAIKGGKVVKLLNVNRGKPTLSFKEISTILEQELTTESALLADRSLYESNAESISLADRSLYEVFGFSKVKSIHQIYNDNCLKYSSDKISQDLDDTFLGEMTLKQLKKKCKARKREIPRSVDKVVKQEYVESHPEDDSFDLEETLGSLKRKVSGKSKSRKMQKCESLPKTIAVKSEPVLFDQDFLQVSGGIDMCATIKVAASKAGYTLCGEEACFSDDLHSSEHQMVSIGKVIGETQVTDESCNKEMDSLIIVEEPIVSNGDHAADKSPPTEISVCEEMMEIDDLGIIEKVASDLPDPDPNGCSPREESKSSLIAEHQVCVLNQIGYENKKHSGSSFLPPEIPICKEMIEVDDPVIIEKVTSESPEPDGCSSSLIAEGEACVLSEISYEFIKQCGNSSLPPESSGQDVDVPVVASDLPILAQEDDAITDVLTCNESPDILLPLWNVTACNDTCISSSHENKSPMHIVMSPEPDNQALNSDGGSCLMIPGSLDKSVNNQNIKAIPGNCGMPVLVKVESMDDSDYVSMPVASEIVECLQHPPARILSSRKSISPDSQEKLCRAMKSIELPDYQETEHCKKRLHFEKQVNGDASVNVGSDQVFTTNTVPEHTNTADISPNSEQKMKRGKEDRKRFRPNRGVNKAANFPSWYRLHSGCACMQGRSQHIVDFAQQQMTDIERLAVRLAKDLRSMKEIVIETLLPEARRTAKHNTTAVRIAVESASKVEDMARKLLGTMSRDCNRFCKIISLGEKDSASVGNKTDEQEAENKAAVSVENSPGKEEAENDTLNTASRKKLKFADESGGSLCTVRLIEDQQSLLLDTPIESSEVRAD